MKFWQVVLVSLIAGFIGSKIRVGSVLFKDPMVTLTKTSTSEGPAGMLTLGGPNSDYLTYYSASDKEVSFYISHKGEHRTSSSKYSDAIQLKVRDDEAYVRLSDTKDRRRIEMKVEKDGTPTIKIYDENNRAIWSAPSEK